jgi:hypothetical protein
MGGSCRDHATSLTEDLHCDASNSLASTLADLPANQAVHIANNVGATRISAHVRLHQPWRAFLTAAH